MALTTDTYTLSSSDPSGACGIHSTVNITARKKEFYRNGVLDKTLYYFYQNYVRVSGCHNLLENGSDHNFYLSVHPLELVKDEQIGTTDRRKTYVARATFRAKDYCGACYNPNNLDVLTLTESHNSINSNESSDAKSNFDKMVKFARHFEFNAKVNADTFQWPSRLDTVTTLKGWSKMWDISSNFPGVDLFEPCSDSNKALCDLTP